MDNGHHTIKRTPERREKMLELLEALELVAIAISVIAITGTFVILLEIN